MIPGSCRLPTRRSTAGFTLRWVVDVASWGSPCWGRRGPARCARDGQAPLLRYRVSGPHWSPNTQVRRVQFRRDRSEQVPPHLGPRVPSLHRHGVARATYFDSVNSTVLITAVTAVLSSIIGASAVLVAQRNQWKRDASSNAQAHLKRAVEEVVVKPISVSLRSQQLNLVAGIFSSPVGQISLLLRTAVPVDVPTLFESMNADLEALNRAASQIWMAGDQRSVKLVNAVAMAAASVISAHHAPRAGNRVAEYIRRLSKGVQPGDPTRASRHRTLSPRPAESLSSTPDSRWTSRTWISSHCQRAQTRHADSSG